MMPALVTPFDADGAIDFEAHAHNVTFMAEKGVNGFLLGGSTGEGPYLEPAERRLLVESTRELAKDAFLLCGVAAQSNRQAIAQVEEAAAGGADAALVMTPTTLARTRADAIVTFYRALEAASPLPILLYSVPNVTMLELAVEHAMSLASRPNIVGMKDSGGHPVRVQQIAGAAADFRIFAGASAAVALSVIAGAYGAITASANYAPTLVRDVVDAARKGMDKAAEAQERLAGLSRLVDSRGVPGIKLAAEITGLHPGLPRLPLQPLTEDEASKIRRQLEALKGQLLG
jgi:dihydrodipicolinate synthase/N-acetylneuraminate lyase